MLGTRRPLVLNVDDRAEVRYLRTRALAGAEFDVREAANGEEALTLAARERPDLVLLDVRLPDMDGLEVCRRIKTNPTTAVAVVVYVSAVYTEREKRVEALENGADAFLVEPVDPTELVATVRALLRARLAEADLRQGEELVRTLIEVAPALIVALDRDGRIILFNRACEELTGYRRDEVVGRSLLDLFAPPAWRERVAALAASERSEVLVGPHETPWLTRAGEERLVEWRTFLTTDVQGERLVFGIGHDVTERDRAAARQFLQFSVTRVLADARSLDEAAAALLEAVCQLLRWDVGELWAVDHEAGVLRRQAMWAPGVEAAEHDIVGATVTCAPGVGLVGRAWLAGKPAWSSNAPDDPEVVGGATVRVAGLRSALAFPVLTPAGVQAVVAFFGQAPRELEPQLLAALADIGEQVGQFIERTRADAALRGSEARLRLALEAAEMGWWEWDIESGRTIWSPELDRLFGLPSGGFRGTHETFLEMVHPEDRARLIEAVDRTLDRGDDYEAEFRVIRADGTIRWAAVRGRLVRDASGRPIRMIGVDRDVTAARRDEEERAQLAELGRALNESLDLDVLLSKVAEAARRLCSSDGARVCLRDSPMYECDVNGVRRHPDSFLRPGVGMAGHVLDSGQPLRTHDYWSDSRFTRSPAARVEGIVTALTVPIRGRAGVDGVLGVFNRTPRTFTDLDEALLVRLADYAAVACRNAEMYRRAEEARTEAEAASRSKDRFLATLSHELRNPLASIGSAVEALSRIGRETPEAVRLREIAARQTRHLGRLLRDLLDVTRLSFGKLALSLEPLDLRDMVARCVETMEAAGHLGRHSVTVAPAPEPVPVVGDAARLEQVTANLLDNAAKYSPPDAPIRVAVERHEGLAVLRVRDAGIGLPPESLERIFEPFAQFGERPPGGLGLGLAIVRGLVRQHGGTVVARSAGPGQGTELEVRLPLTAAVAAAPRPAGPVPPASPRRIVLVEDSEDMREALAALLGVLGHRVEVAADGERGIELIVATRPEVALVDLALPGIDGYEVARRVRAALGSAPFLLAVSGYGAPADRERAREAGFDRHLTKPVDPTELERLLAGPDPGSPAPP